MGNIFKVQIVLAVYVWGVSKEGKPITTCGFLEDTDNRLSLPTYNLEENKHAAQVAISICRDYIKVDPRTLDIVPLGFFDPIRPALSDEEKASRIILLAYKTKIHPGTPVHKTLRFLQHEELEIARPRITRGHYEAYRAG